MVVVVRGATLVVVVALPTERFNTCLLAASFVDFSAPPIVVDIDKRTDIGFVGDVAFNVDEPFVNFGLDASVVGLTGALNENNSFTLNNSKHI